MPSDALTYSLAVKELNKFLAGGKIEKITMPEKDEILLTVRAQGKNFLLCVSAGTYSRIHITSQSKPSPAQAFSFCMNLRKNIGGGVVKSIEKEEDERVIYINILFKNELGVREDKRLICEMMGKYSNIILCAENGKIYESIKHIAMDSLSKRPVFAGLTYTPPTQNKLSPLDFNGITSLNFYSDICGELLKSIKGLAPVSIAEAVFNAGLALQNTALKLSTDDKIKLANALKNLYCAPVAPCVLNNTEKDFFMRPYNCLNGEYIFFDSLNKAMDFFYTEKDKAARLAAKSKSLVSAAKNALKRAEKRLGEFYFKQESGKDLEDDRIKGELITANIYRIKAGDAFLTASNFYDNNNEVTIKLDSALTPAQNAQAYFKKYSKKKRALLFLGEQIKKTELEIADLQEIFSELDLVREEAELDDIAEEMAALGLIKEQKRGKNHKTASPIRFSADGFNIFVGKNNAQNDRLVKNSSRSDIWLHIKGYSGSHVVIETLNKPVPDKVLLRAAEVAAYYSKAKGSDKAEVDYTLIKHVNKPAGASLGKVVYVNHKTLVVVPKNI